MRRAHATHPIAAVQSEWSLFSRDIEAELVPTARELGVSIVAYSPLGRGMLTGSAAATTTSLMDYRRFLPRWRKENLATNLEAVAQVQRVASELEPRRHRLPLPGCCAKARTSFPSRAPSG